MSFTLLDTNLLLDANFVADLSEYRASIVSRGEIVFGLHKAEAKGNAARVRTNKALLEILDNPLLGFWLPFDQECSDSYGLLAAPASLNAPAKARSKDALIAATAHAHGVKLATKNLKDFQLFEPLIEVVSP